MDMRLLIYSQDSMGLGHLRRTYNIATEVLARKPDSSILIMCDSPATPFFVPLQGMDYLKLPTIVKRSRDEWQTNTLPLDIKDVLELRSKLILETFHAFSPNVVLVDHMPLGALGELKLLLDSATQAARPPRLFLGLRDVLEDPKVIRRAWTEAGAYAYLKYYDTVLIYGSRGIYDAVSAYDLASYAQRLVYCNYVASKPQANLAIPSSDEPLILVMGGGGADAFPMAKAFLDAVPVLSQNLRFQALVLTGSNMPDYHREALIAQSASKPVHVKTSPEDAIPLLQKASVVVTMAGYNSLCEVMQLQKKALVIPRNGPSAEQRIRSRLFAQRQLIRMLEIGELTPDRLAQEITQLLMEDDTPNIANVPPLDGAERAAMVITGASGFEDESGLDSVTELAGGGG